MSIQLGFQADDFGLATWRGGLRRILRNGALCAALDAGAVVVALASSALDGGGSGRASLSLVSPSRYGLGIAIARCSYSGDLGRASSTPP